MVNRLKLLKHSVDSLHDVCMKTFQIDNVLYQQEGALSKKQNFEQNMEKQYRSHKQ